MEPERPKTSGRSALDRRISSWRNDEDITKSDDKIERPITGISRPQTRQDRPLSRRGIQNELTRVGSAFHGMTPKSGVARPPSASVHSQRGNTASSRLNTITSAMGKNRMSTGLSSTSSVSSGLMFDRPITQHGVAGIRPGTTRGLPMTRQIQDKRYYEGLMQLKIRELNQEISIISKEIDNQNKERATFMHYDSRAKDLASELTELQGKLADYNIVIDKVASNVDKDMIEHEIKDMKMANDRASVEIERLFEQRRLKEQQLNEMEDKIELEQKKAERIIESMDLLTRNNYDKLINERNQLENEVGRMQREIDLLTAEKLSLEEQMSLSQIKQEAVKLRIKISEVEKKREKLKEEEKNKLSPDEEREHLLNRVKQDNMDIMAAEKRIAEAEKRISEAEQELEQLDNDLEDNHSDKQIKYNELRKREEAIEQFMPTFEQNKDEEMEKLKNLEENVVEKLRTLAYAIDQTGQLFINDEMAILNISNENSDQVDQSFEGLSKEHIRLQQTIMKMENLEKKLNQELIELNEKITQRQNELIMLEDLEGLKARSEMKQEELITLQKQLKIQQPNCKKELTNVQKEHEALKSELEKNEIYIQISALEEKLDKLKLNNESIQNFISQSRDKMNYQPLKDRALDLVEKYNIFLRDNTKSVY
ncbi:hypothetical protein PV325_009744 [Microctonus aethiopoides]|uniref:Intraflagellar transport protein 74 homolog n=1 Tax=Microctonus aethiopoides TaxID=144406 RepID=A0AA39KJS2_9HYME|nr:hypothetical protein PV325_009744 [Microctonus aethiopoides]KAK0163932.1 hypothetical protein PV328_002617 [Microctonus aethiopoides]